MSAIVSDSGRRPESDINKNQEHSYSSNTEQDEDQDSHRCGKCRLDFPSIEEFIRHKLDKDNCKVLYTRQRRLLLPHVVQKPDIKQVEEPTTGGKRKRGRPPNSKSKSSCIRSEHIIERMTYNCEKCDKTFNRESTLRRHVELVHDAVVLSDEEDVFAALRDDNDDDDNGEGEGDGAIDEANNMDTTYVIIDNQPVKKIRLENDEEITDTGEDATLTQVIEVAQLLAQNTSHKIPTPKITINGEKVRPHVCQICDHRFKEHSVLRAHMLTHTNEKGYPCPYKDCTFAFKTKGSLKRHIRRHTGERPFKCDKCNRTFRESGALTRHLKSRTPCTVKTDADLPRYGRSQSIVVGDGNTEITDENGQTVTAVTSTDIEIAVQTVAQEMEAQQDDAAENISSTLQIQCKACDALFPTPADLKAHLQTHLEKMPFTCQHCIFATDSKEHLNEHILEYHTTEPNNKDDENNEVPTEKELTEEENIPTIAETEELNDDNNGQLRGQAAMALTQMIDMGLTAETGLASKTTVGKSCPYCNRVFRGHSYLRLHLRIHTGVRPHKCPHCLKGFTSRDALNKHLFVHTNERQYKCGECGKMFKRISHVKEHLKIHTNDRPFACSLCQKRFKTNNACKVHIRTHTTTLPWKCQFCAKLFREKGSLERHVRTHTGDKPYSCQHCGRKFAEHGTLSRHLKAKVPCTKSLYLKRQTESDQQEEYPTVLAEFSSVVADTQQYIVPATTKEQEEVTTELLVLGSDDAGQQVQTLEIVTDEDGKSILADESGNSYVIVSDACDNFSLVDSVTGNTISIPVLDQGNLQITDIQDGGFQTGQMVAIETTEGDAQEVVQTELIDSDQTIAIITDPTIQTTLDQFGQVETITLVPDDTVQINAEQSVS